MKPRAELLLNIQKIVKLLQDGQLLQCSLHGYGNVDNHLITSGWKNDQNGREVTDLPRFRGPYLTNLAQQQHVFGTRCT